MNYNKYINSSEEINNLRKDLKETKNTETKTTSDNSTDDIPHNLKQLISQEVKRKINEKIGLEFEDNIRGVFKYMFNLKESTIPREINYRKVEIENEIQQRFVVDFYESTIPINGEDYKFVLNKDFSISILEYNTNNLIKNVEDTKTNIIYIIKGKKLTFFNRIQFEVDGIFELDKSFNLSKFTTEYFSIIYSNIEKDENNYEYLIIECILDKNKIHDITIQIKRDSLLFKPLLNKKCIFIGIINSENINSINFKKIFGEIKCVILGLKGHRINGKYMKSPIDWDLEQKFKKLDNRLETTEKDIEKINEDIKDIKNDLKDIKEEISSFFNLFKESLPDVYQKIESNLGKKRYRSTTPRKEGKKDE